MKFMQLLFEDKVKPDDIDQYVQVWHDSNSTEELHEFLGMSWPEYACWATLPSSLPTIIKLKKKGLNY